MVAIVKMAYEDILKEIQRVPKPSHYRYELKLYPDGGDKVAAMQIIHMDFTRNFEVTYADQIMVSAVFQQKDVSKVIYPNQNKLMAELTRIPIGEISEEVDPNRKIVVRNYRVALVDAREDSLRGQANFDDGQGMREITMQFYDPVIEWLRLQTFGTSFYKEPVDRIIQWHLCYHSKLVKASDEHAVKGVEIWPVDRADTDDVTVVPHGTSLLDLPAYLQQHCNGVYNHGIGYYLHSPWTPYGDRRIKGRVWYVYPLYDGTRYEKSKYRLDVIVIPPNQVQGQDRSWYLKDSTMYISTTGQMTHADEKDIDFANQGNGVRFAKATDSFNKWAPASKNVAKADPSQTTAQFFAQERENKKQAAPFGKRRFTDNIPFELSELTAREVQYVKLVWNNASSEFLIPGMPTRIIYFSKRGKEELYGTLLAIEENVSHDNPSMTSRRMRTNCGLTFAVAPRKQ